MARDDRPLRREEILHVEQANQLNVFKVAILPLHMAALNVPNQRTTLAVQQFQRPSLACLLPTHQLFPVKLYRFGISAASPTDTMFGPKRTSLPYLRCRAIWKS